MTAGKTSASAPGWSWLIFALSQVLVMLLAVSGESLWIDEFWTAHFGALHSFGSFLDLLLVPSGSQTPLHFLHFYGWGQLNLQGEYFFRLANLPLFVVGQLAVFWALRDAPRTFAWLFLGLSALHPLVWQYANEARPYTMMFAGSQMILAYLLHLHFQRGEGGAGTDTGTGTGTGGRKAETLFLLSFVVGGILLFGASLLGAFWVFTASVWMLLHHQRQGSWRALLRGANPWLLGLLLLVTALLGAYYLSSLLKGAGASRLASSTLSSTLFAAYELLGLGGIGPGRLELRSQGAAALAPHALALLVSVGVIGSVLAFGLKEARRVLGRRECMLIGALGLFPVLVVVCSGFVMNWRVLGRHLIAALPLLNLILALGLAALLQDKTRTRWGLGMRRLLAVVCVLLLGYSSASLRWGAAHSKDDYRAAAAVAQAALERGQRVWWAADVIGAQYYGLPGEFDVMGELTSVHKPLACRDLPGVQVVANATRNCLATLSVPDWVVLSKPETFDTQGALTEYLKAARFTVVQSLPAFTVWRRPDPAAVAPK